MTHNQLYGNFSEALKKKNGIAVLGVLFHISEQNNPLVENILDSATAVNDEPGQSNAINEPFAPMQLLPKDRSSYFRYEGSLTTPPCTEVVVWTVWDTTVPVSMAQIERFKQVKDANGTFITHNFRQVQRLNSRTLVYVRDDFLNAKYSASSAVQLSMATIITAASFQLSRLYF